MKQKILWLVLCTLTYSSGCLASLDRSHEHRLWLADQILSARQAQNTFIEHDALMRLISIDPNDP